MSSLALLTGLLALAAASPPTFRVNQVAVGKTLKNGPLQVAQTYQKFNKPVPANVANAAAAVQSGSVVATPQAYDEDYLCPVSIGTPAQVLNLDFDTGSSDLWVFSSLMKAGQRSGHSFYTPKDSSTSVLQSGESWSIGYGDGSTSSGKVYADTVVVGGVTATSQAVEAATVASSQFTSQTNLDGLLGLGFPNINSCSPNACTPFVQQVQSTLPSKVFTADLKAGEPGSYDFGFINASKYTGDITYTAINSANGYWQFKAGGYCVGKKDFSASFTTIADTGTTLIYLPDKACTRYYNQVAGSSNSASEGGYIFPCNATLPNFYVKIAGVSYEVPASYMNYAPIGDGTCFGGLQSSAGIGINILGDIFLKAVFAVFDVGNTRIGFAAQS